MTVLSDAFDSDTVNARSVEPELPSATVALAIDTVGGVTTTAVSSLVMVPMAVAVPRLALVGALNATVKVSLASTAVSPRTATLTFAEVTPGANVRVPLPAV